MSEQEKKFVAIRAASHADDFFDFVSKPAQVLYVLLVISADEDGMVANPCALARYCKAESRDLLNLEDYGYIEQLPDGMVCVNVLSNDLKGRDD